MLNSIQHPHLGSLFTNNNNVGLCSLAPSRVR